MKKPKIIAHRGGAQLNPENTDIAFDYAFKTGADGIETDLQLTKDGHFICWHDQDFARLQLKNTEPGELSLKETQNLNASQLFADYRKPTAPLSFNNLLMQYGKKDNSLFLELKSYSTQKRPISPKVYIEKFIEHIKRCKPIAPIYIISFEETLLKAYLASHSPWPAMFLLPENSQIKIENWWKELHGIGFDIEQPHEKILSDLSSTQKTMCYTCLHSRHYEKAQKLSVDYWMCDNHEDALLWSQR